MATALAGCADDGASDVDLAAFDVPGTVVTPGGSKADAAWSPAPTLHVGERVLGRAAQHDRQVYPVWLAGSDAAPIALDVVARAEAGGSVRVAVLGPLVNGKREVLAAGGYASPRANVEMTVEATARGEYLVVVGSHQLATETAFSLATYCGDCTAAQTDVVATPKTGALVGEDGLVKLELGDVLADRATTIGDVEVELWAAPPAQLWAAQKIATSVASGNQVNFVVPHGVAAGDDFRLVVRQAGGRVLDSGIVARYAPEARSFVRMDALRYGDLPVIGASGVVGYFEGVAAMSMRSEDRHLEIATDVRHAEAPGAVGNGFGAFDATFAADLEDGTRVPRDGELLSIGFLDGNGDYRRLGCFEYCNDLAGTGSCTGGERACPSAAW